MAVNLADYLPPKELWPTIELPEGYGEMKELNLAEELLDKNIREGRGEDVAIHYEDEKVTYKQLYETVNRLANGLKELGIGRGYRVGFRSANIPEAIVSNFAILKVGAVPVPMSPLWSRKEIAYSANNSEMEAMFVSQGLLEEVEIAREQMTSLKQIIVIGGDPEENREKGYQSYDDLVKKGKTDFQAERLDADDLCLILYTSGTTGPPKGCCHSNIGVLAEIDIVGKYVWKLKSDDVIGGSAPVSFAAGYGTFATIPFRFSSSVSLLRRFSPEALFKVIEKHKVTVLTGLPTAYRRILTDPNVDQLLKNYDWSSVRMCSTAGEALGAETYYKWKEKTGLDIYEGLGATEVFHLVISNTVAPKGIKPGSIGTPLPGWKARIISPDTGAECKAGEVGALSLKGPTGILYWKPYADDERLLKKQKDSLNEGWSLLGDMTYADEDGYIFFVTREDDMIKSSGYRIGPEEIERALAEHPSVAEAAVIGVPDPIRGQIAKAFVVVSEGYTPSEELKTKILDFLRDKIAVFKLPRAIEFIESLPKTPTGKLLRRILRDREKQKASST